MRKIRRKLAQVLTATGAGLITATTIAPGLVGATEVQDNRLIAHIGDTLEVASGDVTEYMIGEDKYEVAQKSIGDEDVYSVSYTDEADIIQEKNISIEDGEVVGNVDVEEKEMALIGGDGLIDAEEETTIAAAIKKLEADGKDVTYADVQSIVWTVETKETVLPVNTVNTEVLKSVYASIEDGSVLDAIEGLDITSVNAKSDKNDYVVFYYTPQVTEVVEETEPAEIATTETTSTETEETVAETEAEVPTVDVESEGTLVNTIAESVEEVKKEAEVVEEAIENSGTTEISKTVDVELEKKIEEDKEKKDELKETKYMLSTNFLLIDSNSSAKTIDGVYKDSPEDVLIQHSQDISLYDDGNGYLVGFINATDMNEHFSDIIDFQVGYNDVSGTLIDGVSFDNNIIKIPTKYFEETQYNNVGYEIENKIVPVKAQFMVKYDDSQNTESTINIEIENNTNIKVNDISSIKANDNDVSFDIPIATSDTPLTLDNIDVFIDNSNIAENKGFVGVTYKDGIITIPHSSVLVNNIKIVIKENSISQVEKVYTDKFNGISVTAEAESGAFPEGTTMVLGEVPSSSVDDIISSVENNTVFDVVDKKAIDISFQLNGKEIEPANGKSVNVKLNFDDSLLGENYAIIHKHEDKTNLISTNMDDSSAEFLVKEFSEFVAIAANGSNIGSVARLTNVDKDKIESLNNGQFIEFKGNIQYGNPTAHVNTSRLYGTSGQNAFAADIMYGVTDGVALGHYQHRNDAPSRPDDQGVIARVGAYDATNASVGLNRPDWVVPYQFYLAWALTAIGITDESVHIPDNIETADWNRNKGNYHPLLGNEGDERYYSAPLYCSHTSASGYGRTNSSERYADGSGQAFDVPMKAKIMALNTGENPYVVIAFVTGTIDQDSQEGVGIYKFDLEFAEKKGTFEIIKSSSNPSALERSNYSLEGAEFGVFTNAEASGNPIQTLTTNADGWAKSGELDEGTYYIKETKAPKGHLPSNEVKAVNVPAGGNTRVDFVNEIEKSRVRIRKVSADPTVTDGNNCYSLAGAVFKLYNNKADANQDINSFATLTTGEDGWTEWFDNIWYGSGYAVREVTAPKGFEDSDEVKTFNVSKEDAEVELEIANKPKEDPIPISIIKVDDSGKLMPNVSMEGAEFLVNYYANDNWEGKPNKSFTITTDENGIGDSDDKKLSLGTYTIQEQKAPNGYKVDDTVYKGRIILDEQGNAIIEDELEGKSVINAKDDNVFEIKNERKPEGETDAVDGNTEVQSGVVGKTTIIDTFTYRNLYEGREYTLKGVLLDKETGKPLLVNGKEIRVEKTFIPTQPNGTETMEFEVDTTALAGKSTVVGETLYEDGKEIVVHVDVNDERQEVKFPSVGTKAIDKNSTIQAGVNGKTTYVDTVSYTNLDVGSEYKVTGVLMDKDTGKELQVNGKTVTASQTFKPTSENGTVKVEFNIDASSLAGKSAVVFEKLFIVKGDGTEVEVAKHENINDKGQEVATPEIGTSAEDFQTKNHTAVVGETTLVDTVTYKNLIPNKEYTMTGTLMDKETNKPVEIDGKKVTKSITFTPTERDGKVDIRFDVDTSSLEGKDTVFFEKLLYSGVELTSHEEPGDEGQKIDIPKIRTTAIDGQTKNHTGVTGVTTIVDTVKYTNLTIGQEYIMEGIVMDKATGKELTVDGKTVTATQKFTPEAQDGTVDVTFNIDASELKGKDVVVFETLYQGKLKITEHKSINDKGQTINYPEVRTRAINEETQNQTNTAVGKTTIIDTVTYKNLTVGQEYIMQGKLVDKATGEYLKNENGEDIVNEIKFTPEKPTGEVQVPIEVDTSILQGKKIVVFEKLYQGEVEVTAHEDINDIPQNTEVPTIGTTATDLNTGNHTGVAEETTIVDEVKYTGLTIGQKYIVKGVLMDKTTGEPVVIDGKEIVSEQEFVVGEEVEYTHPSITKEATDETVKDETETDDTKADDTKTEDTKDATDETKKDETTDKTDEVTDEVADEVVDENAYEPIEGVTSDGTVKLFYDLNARELKGHQVVVFETLYQIPNDETPSEETTTTEPVKIIAHEDIEDEGQTVDIPDAKTTATDKNTTTHTAVVGKTTIVDEVRFTGLTVGETYTFKGVLVDKETGEPLMQDGKEVTAEAELVAETKDGSQLLEFEVDTEVIAGRSVVAEEEVWYKDIMITDHKDLTDEDQTVNVPTIATTATGQNGKTVEYGSSATIIDTVTYTNLTVGESYVMSGTMVDQNGNAVSNVESVPFVAESANGTVDVKFVIDTTAHAGQKLVAFEELTAENGTKITEHKDLTDEAQTVYVDVPPEVPVTPSNPTPSTGNKSAIGIVAGIAGGAAALAAGLALGKKRKKENEI